MTARRVTHGERRDASFPVSERVGHGGLLGVDRLIQSASRHLEIRAGIPLSYVLVPNGSFDWFFVPSNFILVLGIIAFVVSLLIILIGKRISNTPGNLTLGLISYGFLYGLVVPLWLIRATSDVTLGRRRDWRF